MPSNYTFVCIPCRVVLKRGNWLSETYKTKYSRYERTRYYGVCPSCKGRMECYGKHWTAPKKNNDRAWKRIANGDTLWNHRKLRKRGRYWGENYRSNHSPDMGG